MISNFLFYTIGLIYLLALLVILSYSFAQAYLLSRYLKNRRKEKPLPKIKDWPKVTVQAPVFNESAVIERLINALSNLDYPKDKLQIQILDDSTDDTTAKASQLIARIREEKEVDITLLRRKERKGFKAGALKDAMAHANGEFIAIFDADFIPNADFLRKTIPHFQNDKIGVVQTRWGHLNSEKMMLTELQAFGLNGHFSIEQTGRNTAGHFINFNGTGGVWRKQCIEVSGGWSADTLTEDLDLSYRAQMKGWDFLYLEDVEAPAELPETISALKNQQHRWMKGGAECFRKNAVRLIRQSSISFTNKIHGLFHLFNSSVFVGIFLISVLSVPIVYFRSLNSTFNSLFHYESIFFVSTLILYFYYFFSYKNSKNRFFILHWFDYSLRFFQFLAVSLGLSFNNAKAVLEAYLGKSSGFVRTPKFNGKKLNAKTVDYPKNKIQFLIEVFLLVYFFCGMLFAIFSGIYGLLPFQILLILGYGYVVLLTYYDIFGTQENSQTLSQTSALSSEV